MIRRNILQPQSQRTVKWWLLAAVVALGVGGAAEFAQRQEVAQEPVPADTTDLTTELVTVADH